MYIHLEWEGPFTFEELISLNTNKDYGIYQVYGVHPIYGADVLLYIGKAQDRTFSERIPEHTLIKNSQDSKRITIYVGRIAGYEESISDNEWSEQISISEQLLIYSHWPAANSSGLNIQFTDQYHDIHLLNWGQYKQLLPEISGARFSNFFTNKENYSIYGS